MRIRSALLSLTLVVLVALPACEPKDTKPAPASGPRVPAAVTAVAASSPTVPGAGNGGARSGGSGGGAPVARPRTDTAGPPSDVVSGFGDPADCDNSPVRPNGSAVRFAVLGDYGIAGPAEEQVARLVKSWNPEFILTTGDNNYPSGGADTIDANIGQYFHEFICPYRGGYGPGATRNRFFPSLGNHDWYTLGAAPYLDYFTLPGKERYYDLVWGDVHFFALDSDPNEPDGTSATSTQAQWLKERLAASKSRWKLVTMHHPPYSSGPHLSTTYMQWPYKEWGANLVLAGHDHIYERIEVGGLTYVVTGLGGANLYAFNTPIDGSTVRYSEKYGAGLIEADSTRLHARFFTGAQEVVDEFVLTTQ